MPQTDLEAGLRPDLQQTKALVEDQLARLLVAGHHPEALEGLAEIDWPGVSRRACAEGVAGLLLLGLESTSLPTPPPAAVIEELTKERYQGLAANFLMREETAKLLQAMKRRKIPVLLLKGIALQEMLYPRLDLRRMGDIDLLVPTQQAAAASEVLLDLGYERARPELWPGSDLRFENESGFWRPGPIPMMIELHWHLFDSPHYQASIDPSFFWADAQPVDVAGQKGLAMRPDALLLYLCTHLELHHARDHAPQQRWLLDICELLAREADSIDWPALVRSAEALGLRIPFAQALKRVGAPPWNAAIPSSVQQRLRGGQSTREERRERARSMRHDTPAMRLWNDLTSIPSYTQRLRFLLFNLIPSAAYMRSRYETESARELALAYPKRWAAGLLQFLRAIT